MKIPQKKCSHCNGTGKQPDDSALGAQLMAKRKIAKKTLSEVSTAMGISVGYLSDMEHGRKRWSEQYFEDYREALKN